jgi:DnaJ family protein A protein 5
MLFNNIATYMHPGCYTGYHNEKGGFYQVYTDVFENIVSCELKQSERTINLPSKFGTIDTDWEDVNLFYRSWDSFSSALNFAWEDKYNSREDGESRRIRRLMDEENNKARKAAKKTYNNDIMQLVAFVKRRDPRVKSKLAEQEKMKKDREAKQKVDKIERKKGRQQATEAWREASMQGKGDSSRE